MAFDDNWVMSYNDLQELVDTEGFTAIATIPVSTQLVGKGAVMANISVNPDYFDTWSSIRMVPRALIHKPDVVVPVHKQYYDGFARTSSDPSGLCGLTESSWTPDYFDGSGDYPVTGDTAYSGVNDETPKNGDGLYRILRNTTTEVQYNIAVASNGTITVYECAAPPSLTVFTMTIDDYSSSTAACSTSSVSYFQYRHDGVGELPEYGDTIYEYYNGDYTPISQGWRISFYDSGKFVRYTDSNGVYQQGQYC